MKYIKLYEHWEDEGEVGHEKNDHSESLIASLLNNLVLTPTDSASTYDFMMKEQDKISNLLSDMNPLNIFNIVVKLNKDGIKNFINHFKAGVINRFKADKSLNVWEIRNLEKSIETVYYYKRKQ